MSEHEDWLEQIDIDWIDTDEQVSNEIDPDMPYLTFEQRWDMSYPRDWHGNGQHILNEWNKHMPLEHSMSELMYVLPNIVVWWTSPTTARVVQTHEVSEELEAIMTGWACRIDGEFCITEPIDKFLET